MKALDADASNPDSGFWSSRIATTEEVDEEDTPVSSSARPTPTFPLSPSAAGADSVGFARMRLNSLRAFSRSGTFRIPKAIVSCIEKEGEPQNDQETPPRETTYVGSPTEIRGEAMHK